MKQAEDTATVDILQALALQKPSHPSIRTLIAQLQQATANVQKLNERHARLTAEMAELKAAGLEDKKPHWRDGNKLVLVGKMEHGKRERTYVGSNPEKIAEAKAAIERQRDYTSDKYEAEAIIRAIDYLSRSIRDGGYYAEREVEKL